MLIGIHNRINQKLVEEISLVYALSFVPYQHILIEDRTLLEQTPRILLVNLMDLGLEEEALRLTLKKVYPDLNLIGMHCFQSELMIQETLVKGYDQYVSVFDILDNFEKLIRA
ncbi:hypothetical protein [Lutimonas sp.]|uniref:hypothetical protein n=1 Tax=Lutimonas sp. TaxID=1872403 RepID=UPI003D9B0D77